MIRTIELQMEGPGAGEAGGGGSRNGRGEGAGWEKGWDFSIVPAGVSGGRWRELRASCRAARVCVCVRARVGPGARGEWLPPAA